MSCDHYPCHDLEEMNCFFCYCPFYSFCSNLKEDDLRWIKEEVGLGGYWLDRSDHDLPPVFACEKCTLLHQKEVVDYVRKKMVDLIAEIFTKIRREKKNE